MNSTFITIICAVVAVVALLLAFLVARGDRARASSAISASVEPKANVEAASTPPAASVAPTQSTPPAASVAPTQSTQPAQSAELALVEQRPDFQRSQPLQPQVTRQLVQDHVEAPAYVAKQTLPVADFDEVPTTVNNHVQPEVSHFSQLTHTPSLLHENNSNEIIAVSRHLYEIAGQVHILQRQSQEIERSLAQLSGVIEHLQQQQHTQLPRESVGSLYTNARPYGESNF